MYKFKAFTLNYRADVPFPHSFKIYMHLPAKVIEVLT